MSSSTLSKIFSKKNVSDWFIMTFGMLIAAIAVHCFLIPSNLVIGSISGLAIVIFRLTGLPVSITTFIINSILLILAYLLIGKEFGIKTVYTALILSPWLYLLEHVMPVEESIMQDPWLDLLCFVLILSASQAILFRINASTGGLDILAKIVNKYLHVDIGTGVTFSGAAICCTAFMINDTRMVIIGLIGTWINGIVLNHFTDSLNAKKKVCIISDDYRKIQEFVINELKRGATLYEVTGGYSNKKSIELVSILTKDEFSNLMEFIEKNNLHCFITAGSVSEIYGLWNKHKHKHTRHLL